MAPQRNTNQYQPYSQTSTYGPGPRQYNYPNAQSPSYNQYYNQQYQQQYQQPTYPQQQPKPQKKSMGPIKILVIIIVIVVILAIIVIAANPPRDDIKFQTFYIDYIEGDLGELESITIRGSIKNIGNENVKFNKISFGTGCAFLKNDFHGDLIEIATDSGDEVVKKGEVVEFEVDLGGVKDTTSSTSGFMKVYFDGLEDDMKTFSVARYYG